ncbi:MAG TPA: PASTA domain-containing protein [bacterium]|nr:PASTA domain-containing protein [bacterium]
MRFRRHLPPLSTWSAAVHTPEVRMDRRNVLRWAGYCVAAALAGYLVAALLLFPAPVFRSRHPVPRVLGMTRTDALAALQKAQLQVRDSGTESHPTAPAGTVIWQDPPPGVDAPTGTRVGIVSSSGPSKVAVPDVTGYDASMAQQILGAAGLTVSRTDSVQAPTVPPGLVVVTRPPAGSVANPGTGVVLVINRGAPTIPVPDVVGMALSDAREKLEEAGLVVGAVTRRRVSGANPGTVIGQSPAAATLAAPGLVVDLIVARAPQ